MSKGDPTFTYIRILPIKKKKKSSNNVMKLQLLQSHLSCARIESAQLRAAEGVPQVYVVLT